LRRVETRHGGRVGVGRRTRRRRRVQQRVRLAHDHQTVLVVDDELAAAAELLLAALDVRLGENHLAVGARARARQHEETHEGHAVREDGHRDVREGRRQVHPTVDLGRHLAHTLQIHITAGFLVQGRE
jgi:hypothetical protein